MKRTALACIAAAFAVSNAGAACAQRLSVRDQPAGARAFAAATAGVADASEPSNVSLNPACAVGFSGVHYTSLYANWTGDGDYFVNTVAVTRGSDRWRGGVAVSHARLDFKVFDDANDFHPFNNQASYMSLAGALEWRGAAGALSAGAALAWDTSEHADGATLVDVGVRAEAPSWSRGRFAMTAAAGASIRGAGKDAGAIDGTIVSDFTTRLPGETRRAGVSIRTTVADADTEMEWVAVTVSADVMANEGGDTIDASAAGMEITAAQTVSARVGYGDGVVGGRNALAWGAGLGHRFGDFVVRLDYARVEARSVFFNAHVFGIDLAVSF